MLRTGQRCKPPFGLNRRCSSGFHVTQKVDMVQLIDGDPEHAG
jgi:hypothetical protein